MKFSKSFSILVVLICNLLISLNSFAGFNYYWQPTSGNNSNTSANWSKNSCSSGTTGAPSSSDTIIFSGCSTANCTINANLTVARIEVQSGYSGTITMSSGITLTFKIGNFVGGTFNGSTGTITVNGSLKIDGTTFTSSSGTLAMNGDFTFKSGTFTHNSGKIIFKRSTPTTTLITGKTGGKTITLNKAEFAASSSNTQFTLTDITIVVNDSLTLSGANQLFLNSDSGSISAKGHITETNSNATGGGDAVITINGTGSQTLASNQSAGYGKLPSIKINTTGTLTLSGTITIGGSSSWEYVAGTVSEGTSKLVCYFNNTLKNSSGGTMKFYDLEFQGNGSAFSVSGTVTVGNNCTTSQTGQCTINSSGGSGVLDLQKDLSWSNTGTTSWGTVKYKFSGTNSQTISGSIVPHFYNFEINKSSNDVTLTTEVQISNTATFTNRYLVSSSSYPFTVLNGAGSTGASSSSFVKGPAKKIGNAAYIFPIGKGTSYKPLSISAPSSATDAYTAEYFNTGQTLGSTVDSLTYLNDLEYWKLDRNVGTSSVTVQLDWDANSTYVHQLSTLRIAYWTGTKWTNLNDNVTTSGTSSSGNIKRNVTVSSFGYFTIGKNGLQPIASAGSNVAFCFGQSASIGGAPSASGGYTPYTYSWSPATGLSSSTTANPTANDTITRTYTLSVTDADGTLKSSVVQVTVYPKPVANAGSDQFLCSGNDATIGGGPTVVSGTPPFTMEWKVGSNTISTLPNPEVVPASTTTYTVTVTDSHGCTDDDAVTMTVDPALTIDAGSDQIQLPGYSSVQLGATTTASGGTSPYTYTWSPSTGLSSSTTARPTTNIQSSTFYHLLVRDNAGCSAGDDVIVTVRPPIKGAVATYGLLSGRDITLQHAITVTGDVGAGRTISSNVSATGSINNNNSAYNTAMSDLNSLYSAYNALPYTTNTTPPSEYDFTNQTFTSGVYKITGNAKLAGDLTCSGDSASYFVFQITGNLTLNNGAQVIKDGIQGKQIFFIINGHVIQNHTATLHGTWMVNTYFSGDTVQGNACIYTKTSDISLKWALLSAVDVYYDGPSNVIYAALSSTQHSIDYDYDGLSDWLGFGLQNFDNLHKNTDPLTQGNDEGGFNDHAFFSHLPELQPRMLRMHFSSFDWNSGWHYTDELTKDQSTGALSLSTNIDCNDEIFDYKPNKMSNRLTDLKFVRDGNNADVLFTMNMLFNSFNFDKDMLQMADELHIPIKYIELGEEMYFGSNRKAYCAFPNAQAYVTTANDYLGYIHTNYPDARVVIPAASPEFFTADQTPSIDGSACRLKTWDAALGLPDCPTCNSTLDLGSNDAISFHLYPQPGLTDCDFDGNPGCDLIENTVGNTTYYGYMPQLTDMYNMFKTPYEIIDRFQNFQTKLLPVGVNAWITEYNIDGNPQSSGTGDYPYCIYGSWMQGLWTALYTLNWLEVPQVEKVFLFNLVQDAGRGCFFGDTKGFQNELGIDITLPSNAWERTAQGNCMMLIAAAVRHTASATKIDFPGAPNLSGSQDPTVYGWRFENAVGDPKQIIILNVGSEQQNIDVNNIISGSLGWEQMSDPSNGYLAYVYGSDQLAYYNDHGVFQGKSDPLNPTPLYPALNHIFPITHPNTTIFELPPYSITRIYVRESQLSAIPNNPDVICVPSATEQVGEPWISTSINVDAQGVDKYTWHCNNCILSATPDVEIAQNSVAIYPSSTGSFSVQCTPNYGSSSTIYFPSAVAAPNVSIDNPAQTYNLSTGAGVELNASPSTLNLWWSPAPGLYSIASGGASNAVYKHVSQVFARPEHHTGYSHLVGNQIQQSVYLYAAYQVLGINSDGCYNYAPAQITRSIADDASMLTVNYSIGNAYFCTGLESISLTAIPPGGTPTYTWRDETDNVGLTGSSNTLTITTSSGQYFNNTKLVSVEMNYGTQSVKAYAEVVMKPGIEITKPPREEYCKEDNLQVLSSTFNDNNCSVTYDWTNGNCQNGYSSNYCYTYFAQETDYDFNLEASAANCGNCNGTATAKDDLTITVTSTNPSASITQSPAGTICPGDQVTLTAAAVNDVYYQWTPADLLEDITGNVVQTKPLYDDVDFTVYMIRIIPGGGNVNGCCSLASHTVDVSSLGCRTASEASSNNDDESLLPKLFLYPNPATNSISFILKGWSQADHGNAVIRDLYGMKKFEQRIEISNALTYTLPLPSNLVDGIYLLEVSAEQQRISGSFIKQH